jgi:DNA-binding CsgD family transcriptional regulator/tetratricopeptide (TPR) repeat protein
MDDVAPIRTSTSFVGRAGELARLESLLDLAAGGVAAGVLVGGDAGVGKTRLTTELAERAARRGAVPILGRSVDLGAGGLPYLPFTDALVALAAHPRAGDVVRRVAADRPTLRRLTGRSDDAAAGDDAAQRLSLYDAVVEALRAVGEQVAPVLLVLEDLHWADASTRDLLRFLLSRLSDDRLLVVGTFRTDEMHRRHPLRALLAELVRLPRVERLDLPPFDDAELRQYLRSLAGGVLDERVMRDIRARSEGNAFYAEELLGAADDCAGAGSVIALPGGLSDVLLARLERLPESVQHVARVASVAGRRVPDRLLRAACERPPDDVELALRDAVAHHVLVSDGADRFAFRHALMQEAVYADLLPGERVRLHARYAALLAAEPSDAGEATAADLARHCLESHDLAGALGAWIRAARAAEHRLAPAEATEHYEQALQLWSAVAAPDRPADVTLVGLGLAAAAAAGQAGDLRRAAALATDASEAARATGDRHIEADARQRLAGHLYSTEREHEAMEQVQAVYALLEGSGPNASRVWAASVEARLVGGSGPEGSNRREQLLRARALVEKALAEARELDLLDAEADLLITLSLSDGMINGLEAADRRLQEVRRRGLDARNPEIALRLARGIGINYLDVGDLTTAERRLTEALDLADRAGLASGLWGVDARMILAEVAAVCGEWDRAIRLVTTERPRLPAREALFLTWPVLDVYAARDPRDGIARVAALQECDPDYPIFWHHILVPEAEAHLWLGDPRAALDAVDRTLDSFRRIGHPLAMGGLITTATGLAALADGALVPAGQPGPRRGAPASRTPAESVGPAHERAEELLAHARTVVREGPTRLDRLGPEGTAWLARAEAEATRVAGRPDVDAWRAAHRAFGYGHVYEIARSARRLAEALLAAGGPSDRAEASDLLRSARATADRLGARPLRDAVDAVGRRHRLDVGAGIAAASVLTPREEEVMRLVAEGLTNREIGGRLFISEKTASVHVSNVLGKLGASGRAEAVAVAHRRGLLGAEPSP